MARKTQTQPKITLSASRGIPFDKLLLSQSNVRHVKAGVSIEELAEGEVRPVGCPGAHPSAVSAERAAHAALLAHRPAGAGRDRRRNRIVRNPGGRAALPGAGTAR